MAIMDQGRPLPDLGLFAESDMFVNRLDEGLTLPPEDSARGCQVDVTSDHPSSGTILWLVVSGFAFGLFTRRRLALSSQNR